MIKTFAPWILLLTILISFNCKVYAESANEQVERSDELGFGFRRVTLAIPVETDFESIGHFGFLYYREQRLCQLMGPPGSFSIAPSGSYVIFQDGPSRNLFLYRRSDGRRDQLTKQFVGYVESFKWNEDAGKIEVLFKGGALENYSIPSQ